MKQIKTLSFEEVLEAAKNAPLQTEEQKRATYEILLKMGSSEELGVLLLLAKVPAGSADTEPERTSP